jgi:S1-C subfamily serine protease
MLRRACRTWTAAVVAACSFLSACGTTTRRAVEPLDAAVEIVADGCPDVDVFGQGLVVAPGRVLTAAHVVAGATDISVRHNGERVTGVVTAFDPTNDLALIAVPTTFAPAVPIGPVRAGDRGTAIVRRRGSPTAIEVTVSRAVSIHTEDIYIEGSFERAGFELAANIEPGDSGAVVVVRGRAVAVVWARTRGTENSALAIDPAPILDRLTDVSPIGNGRCV